MPKQIVFFGSSPFSNIVLEKLLSAKISVIAVVTKIDKPAGRGQKLKPNPVKSLAEKFGIPISTTPLPPPNLGGGGRKAGGGTVVGLVAAYGKIIPQSVLDTFNGHIFNIHPSILPKYRGPSPLQQQILDGVSETGVTIIQLDKEMDHGPIVAQAKDKILPDDTWQSLGERLFAKGAELFLASDLKKTVAQDDTKASITKILTREDGFVPWAEFKPEKLETQLRAYAGWPGVWTTIPEGKRLKLISVKPNILVQIEGKSPQSWPISV